MYLEAILKGEAARRLSELGRSELVVGIPTFKNARTIGPLVQAAGEGAASLAHLRPVILVVDGGSSDETLAAANAAPLPPAVRRVTGLYTGASGKGNGVRAILEATRILRARTVILLEADWLSFEPDYIPRLAAPILAREYDLALPLFTRPLIDNAVTDLIAYPLLRALFGVDVRQPMAGDAALSGELAARLAARDVWETDVARHGFDIWLTTVAITEAVRLCQVRLGEKLDSSRELSLVLDPTFVQAVGTLFRMLDIYRRKWPEIHGLRVPPVFDGASKNGKPEPGRRPDLPSSATPVTPAQLWEAFRSGARRYSRVWRTVLAPSHLRQTRALLDQVEAGQHFSLEHWTGVVLDFAVVYNMGEGDPDKVVAALLPLYLARVAAILRESKSEQIERVIQQQAESFAQHKSYLWQRWQSYVPWTFEGVR